MSWLRRRGSSETAPSPEKIEWVLESSGDVIYVEEPMKAVVHMQVIRVKGGVCEIAVQGWPGTLHVRVNDTIDIDVRTDR